MERKQLVCQGECNRYSVPARDGIRVHTPHSFVASRKLFSAIFKECEAVEHRYRCDVCGEERRYGYDSPVLGNYTDAPSEPAGVLSEILL